MLFRSGGAAAVQVVGVDRAAFISQFGQRVHGESAVFGLFRSFGGDDQVAEGIHLADYLALGLFPEGDAGTVILLLADILEHAVNDQARAEDEEAEAARAKENAEPVDPPQKDKEQI